MLKMGWKRWKKYITIDTVVIFIIIIAVLYCVLTGKGKKKRTPKFVGLGESGWDVSESKKYFRDIRDYRNGGRGSREKGRSKHSSRPKLNKHEERCREIFQDIYGMKFKSVRPDWLKNPVTGRNLELDGYCPDIRTPKGQGLAFEYDGAQHAKFNKHFHRSGANEFQYQVKKDQLKDALCEKHGIFLVRIPHFVAYEDLQRYITNKLDKYLLLPRSGSQYTPPQESERSILSGLYQ